MGKAAKAVKDRVCLKCFKALCVDAKGIKEHAAACVGK